MKKTIQMLLIATGLVFAFTGDAVAKTKQKVKRVSVTLTKDNTVTLSSVVRSSSAGNLVQQILDADSRLKSKDPIFLVLDTPGGSISAGLEMIENLRNVNRPIHTISIYAASMGFETVQGLGKRLIPVDGTLMNHKGWGVMYGEFPGQLDNRYAWVLKRSERMARRAVARTNGIHTLASYSALIENEYWCDGVDCIKQGFADYIVRAKCDKSLNDTHIQTYDRWLEQGMFSVFLIEIKIKKSDCPVNTGVLAYDIYVNGNAIYGTLGDPSVLKNVLVGEPEEEKEKEDEYDGYGPYGYSMPEKPKKEEPKLNLKPEELTKIINKAKETIDATKNRKAIVAP